ncbi:N-acetylglucosamine-6-sulfatase-like [Dysidea avara]|uniref:N-acetylglucosamine-6-sulfatase-like n=1 Tax=Dysidea avara TaxID=196820 RepID=UPI003332FA24
MENSLKEKEPFFAYIAPHAPHVPATPAPQYENALPYMFAPRSPIYNYTATDHHGIMKLQSPMDPYQIAPQIDELFQNRWRTLLSVDDLMMDVVNKLDQHKQLNNTYFLFTSDHGFQLGQFNLPSCKLQPYEHDIRVPMFVKGPGIAKSSPAFVAGMVDIAPTIITLAGGTPPDTMDGHSFENMIKKSGWGSDKRVSIWRDKHTLEYWSLGDVIRYIDGPNNTYIGVRLVNETHNYLYVEYYENNNQ